jgi:uncharacterized protein YcsI (UPF0317 family)
MLNPKPCPLLGQSEPGDWRLPMLGEDLDIRTDIPRYRVWKKGELIEEVDDLKKVWRDDLVAFVLGCSFSFEEALIDKGLEIRHQSCNVNVPMYRTNIQCTPAGPVPWADGGVDAPVQAGRRDRAVQVTTRFPSVHGAPGASRQARAHRHQGHRQAGLRRRRAGARRRIAGVLGLRRHPAIGGGHGEARVLHHPRAGLHAGDRPV